MTMVSKLSVEAFFFNFVGLRLIYNQVRDRLFYFHNTLGVPGKG